MKTLVVLFNLKEGVSPEQYEQWARSFDLPTVVRLPSVDDFRLYRSSGLFGSDQPAPYQYVEVLQILDLEQLKKDVAGKKMQQLVAAFRSFAHEPVYLVCDRVK